MKFDIDNITDFIWGIDQNYCILYINNSFHNHFHDFYGIDLKQGDNILKFLPFETASIWKTRYNKSLKGLPLSFDESYTYKNNRLVYLHTSFTPILFNNNITGVTCSCRDITKNKLNEIELEKYSLLLKSSLESQKDTILFSIDNNFNYLYFNSAHIDVMKYAYNADIRIGTSVLDYMSNKEDRDAALENYTRALNGESHSNVRVFGDQNKEYYESYFNPIKNDANQIVGVTALARNITERILKEEALKKSEKSLKEANLTKDKFFSIIAHDLKAPFYSLIGFSGVLIEEIEKKNFENIHEYAKYIKEVSNQSFSLLNNLLEWSLSQKGSLQFNLELINLNDFLTDLINYLNNISSVKKITIHYDIKENLKIMVDKNMMTTIIRNLVSNGVKYTPEGGQIKISAASTPKETTISVTDTGIGIKPENLNKLFKIEETISTLGTENEKGTGLGLILCYDFVKKHNGKIWAESEFGNGSKFSFTIPFI
ncbi:MAG: PAS domain-containing sensor histidine kinase [Flaviramulus sp.]|nr:PAS domain-containing sensor histidine kinase [Flaviramulus sp.]